MPLSNDELSQLTMTTVTHAAERIDAYITEIAAACNSHGPDGLLVSIILFGSAATGGYAIGLSDLDLLLVLRDDADRAERGRVAHAVSELEVRHGFTKSGEWRQAGLSRTLQRFANRITANDRTFFVCSRADLLSGEPRRILSLSSAQSFFVDRIAIPSIVGSAITVWGEDLLHRVPLLPIRRIDVAKAFFGLFNHVFFVSAVYPLLPEATRYAMDALKRSVHSCYFCHRGRPAALTEEIAYLTELYGSDPTLSRLLQLRSAYQPAFTFVLQCMPAIIRLHVRTARDAEFE